MQRTLRHSTLILSNIDATAAAPVQDSSKASLAQPHMLRHTLLWLLLRWPPPQLLLLLLWPICNALSV
jgi:hypothetical protein